MLDRYPALLEPPRDEGTYKVFSVRRTPRWLLRGTGKVNFNYDRIEIDHPSAGELVLSFHWLKTFQTSDAATIEPIKLLDDPVPFIRVFNSGATHISIVNSGTLFLPPRAAAR